MAEFGEKISKLSAKLVSAFEGRTCDNLFFLVSENKDDREYIHAIKLCNINNGCYSDVQLLKVDATDRESLVKEAAFFGSRPHLFCYKSWAIAKAIVRALSEAKGSDKDVAEVTDLASVCRERIRTAENPTPSVGELKAVCLDVTGKSFKTDTVYEQLDAMIDVSSALSEYFGGPALLYKPASPIELGKYSSMLFNLFHGGNSEHRVDFFIAHLTATKKASEDGKIVCLSLRQYVLMKNQVTFNGEKTTFCSKHEELPARYISLNGITDAERETWPEDNVLYKNIKSFLGDSPIIIVHAETYFVEHLTKLYAENGASFSPALIIPIREVAAELHPQFSSDKLTLRALAKMGGAPDILDYNKSPHIVTALSYTLRLLLKEIEQQSPYCKGSAGGGAS